MIAASQSLTELRNALGADPKQAATRAAREFESLVLSQMLKSASKPLLGDSPLLGGTAGQTARDQYFTQLISEATKGRGLGLAAQLEAQMSARAARVEAEEAGEAP